MLIAQATAALAHSVESLTAALQKAKKDLAAANLNGDAHAEAIAKLKVRFPESIHDSVRRLIDDCAPHQLANANTKLNAATEKLLDQVSHSFRSSVVFPEIVNFGCLLVVACAE